MKCFECGYLCNTIYHQEPGQTRITAVSKLCANCGWESFRTKVPEPLS